MTQHKLKSMAQEIELKFIVQQKAVEALRSYLHTLSERYQTPRQLLNIYYETADNLLRRCDMGLRIRGDHGCYEMTMKVAGRVIGGLHQRPEYNVALNGPRVDLARFTSEMWPEGLDPTTLADAVSPLFSTDFYREKWVVTCGESKIEIALDLGDVNAGEQREPICELEMELLSGNTVDLLNVARNLLDKQGIRLGSLSKAARGYHLAQGNVPRPVTPLTVLKTAPKATVEQALDASLELAMAHWQYHEELWVGGNDEAKAEVANAVALVRHTLMLFSGLIPRKASTHLRDLLTRYDTALNQNLSASCLAFNPESSATKLALTDWLIFRRWQDYIDEKVRAKLAGSFKRFADTHLSCHVSGLKTAFAHPLGHQHQDQLPSLAREIDALRLLAGVYPETLSQPWLEKWEALRHAIANYLRVEIEQCRQEAILQVPFWRHSGRR